MTEINLFVPTQDIKLPYEQFRVCPDINLGYIKHGKTIILIKMIYTKIDELSKLGFELTEPEKMCMAKTYTLYVLQVTDIEKQNIDVLHPGVTYSITDDRVLFKQPSHKITVDRKYDNINQKLSKFEPEPLDTSKIQETLLKIRNMTD